MRNVLNSTLNETAALHRRKKKLTLLVAFLGLMVAISVSFALSRSGFTLDGDAAVSAGGPASTAGETAGSAPASAAGETSGADATQTSAAGETAAGGPASTAGETAGSAPASAAGETDGTDATQTSAAGETAGGGPASTAGETAGSDPASAAGETSGADTTQTSAAGETAAGDAAPSAGEVDGASPAPAGEEPDGVAPAPAAEEPLPGGPALAEQAPNETQMNGLPPVGIVPLDAPLGVGFSSDLRDFVVSPILITDSHGNPVTDSQGNPIVPFDYNGRYDFFITFSEQNLLQFAYDNDVNSPTYGDLYYQLPHELRVVQAVTDKPIYSSTNPGVQIGTYSMDMSGLVTVHMDDVQNNGQPAMKQVVDPETGEMSYVPENFIDFYSNAKITLWLTSEFAKYGDAFAIDFGNGVSITVLVNNSTEPTLAVSKSLLSFDPLSKKAVFSVNFTAKNGPINNINLRDQLVIDGTSINPAGLISNVTVAPNTLTAGAISYEGDAEQHFNIPLTGALAQDATATVNYTVDLTSVINAGDPSNYFYPYTNYVTLTGKDADTGWTLEPVDAQDSGAFQYQKPAIAVTKWLKSYDPVTKIATYGVNVTALGGAVTNINLRDHLLVDGTTINPSGLIANVSVTPPNTLTSGSLIYELNGEYFNIPLTGTLNKGATATVSYTVDLSSRLNPANPGDYAIPYTNYVDVTGKDAISGVDIGPQSGQATGNITYKKGNLKVVKSFLSFDPLTKTALFRVTATAVGSDLTNVNLRDYVQGGPSNTILDPHNRIMNVALVSGPLTLNAPAVTYENDNQHFNIALNGTLANGASTTVQYAVDVSPWLDSSTGAYSFACTNYVDGTAVDVISRQPVTGSAKATGLISYATPTMVITKTQVGYNTKHTATFQVTFTAYGGDLTNVNLRDFLKGGPLNEYLDPHDKITDVAIVSGPLTLSNPAVTYENDNIHFNIPLNGVLTKGSSATVTYTVDYADWVAQAANGDNYSFPYANSVEGSAKDFLSGYTVTGNGEYDGVLTYSRGHLVVGKSIQTPFDPETKKITFAIDVNAQGDNLTHITVLDTMFNVTNSQYYEMTADRISNLSVTVDGTVLTPGTDYTISYGVNNGRNFQLDFGSYTLPADKTIKIIYTLDMSDWIDRPEQWTNNQNDALTYSYNFENKTLSTAMDSAGSPLQGTAVIDGKVSDFVKNVFLGKTGAAAAEETAITVTWSDWFVGDGTTPLNDESAGAVITDTLPDGLIFPNAVVLLLVLTRDDGSTTTDTVTIAEGDTGFTYTVPQITDLDANNAPYGTIVKVTIGNNGTFVTVAREPGFSASADTRVFNNRLAVTLPNGKSTSITVPVTVTKPTITPTINKSYTFGTDQNTGTDYIEFTINYNIPWTLYGKQVWIEDFCRFWYTGVSNLLGFVPDVPDIQSVTLTDSSGTVRTLQKDIDYGVTAFTSSESTNGRGYWRLLLKANPASSALANSLSPLAENGVLTVVYRLSLDTKVYDRVDYSPLRVKTIREILGNGSNYLGYLTNTAYGYYGSNPPVTDTKTIGSFSKRASVRSDGVTVDYMLYISTDVINAMNGASQDQGGLPPIFSDTFSSLMEYVPNTFYVATIGADKYGMYSPGREDLLAGMPAQYFSSAGSTTTMKLDLRQMNFISWNPNGSAPPATGVVTVPPADWYNSVPVSYITINYTMRLKNGVNGTHIVDNRADMFNYGNNAQATVAGPNEVQKTMNRSGGNIVNVEININPEGKTYTNGTADSYTANDQMSATLAPYLSTIKIETKDAQGNWNTNQLSTTPGELFSYVVTGANGIDFVLPDRTPVRITYRAVVLGSMNETIPIENEIWVAGRYYAYTDGEFVITDTHASGSGDNNELTIHKYDGADASISLSGARFALYTAFPYPGWQQDTLKAPPDATPTYRVGSTTFYYVGDGGFGTTDANGDLLFNNKWVKPDYTYLLLELRAPTGYRLPPTPYTLFAFQPTDPVSGLQVIQVADLLSLPNTKTINTYGIIRGYKTVLGDDIPDTVFTFQLTQVADEFGAAMNNPYTASDTTNGAGDFGFPLANLTLGATYYYKIAEVPGGSTDWRYDSSEYIVKVNVADNGAVTVDYPMGGESVGFTNRYTPGGPVFPGTGGSGAPWYAMIGTSTLLLAGFLLFRKTLQ